LHHYASAPEPRRLGAYIGHGAVIDRKFGTTDAAIVLPVSAISARYLQHFGPTATRHAARSAPVRLCSMLAPSRKFSVRGKEA
jgi:hypothetical protein